MSTHLRPEPLFPLMCDDPANDSRAQSQEHQNASYHSAHQQHGNVSENWGVATSEQKIKIHKSIRTGKDNTPDFQSYCVSKSKDQVMLVSEQILSQWLGLLTCCPNKLPPTRCRPMWRWLDSGLRYSWPDRCIHRTRTFAHSQSSNWTTSSLKTVGTRKKACSVVVTYTRFWMKFSFLKTFCFFAFVVS